MVLSTTQKKYLLCIKQMQISGINLTEIAEIMGVAKPTALKILKRLEEGELVNKYGSGAEKTYYRISDKGAKEIYHLEQAYNVMKDVFCGMLNIEEDIHDDLIDICSIVSGEFVEKVLNHLDSSQIQDKDNINFGKISTMPFRVAKLGSGPYGPPSMGDKGFEHPCRYIQRGQQGILQFTAKNIWFSSVSLQKRYKGTLKELYYKTDKGYKEAEFDGTSVFEIPIEAMKIYREKGSTYGYIRIKAVSSSIGMKIAEADMYINLAAIKIIKK